MNTFEGDKPQASVLVAHYRRVSPLLAGSGPLNVSSTGCQGTNRLGAPESSGGGFGRE